MSEPITWRALEEVRNALLLIQVARGYYTDLGLHPVDLEIKQHDDTQLNTLVVGLNVDVDEENSTRSTVRSAMDVSIEFEVPYLTTESAQLLAHRARLDVLRALIPLRKNIKDRPQGITSFSITGSAIQQPEAGAASIIAQVTARVGLVESTTTPATP